MSRLEPTNEASAIAEQGGGTTKVEQLIQQYCPDGVEYKTLGEVCDIHKGVQFNKTDMKEEGSYPVINGGINPSGYVEVFNEEKETITISQGGASAGYVNFIMTRFWLGAHCYAVKPTQQVLNRYLYHFVKQNERILQQCQYGAGIPALAKATIINLSIPVPPQPVQEEIVRILDTLTELQAELQAELQKRLQQYNYYRDNLLSFEGRTDIEWKKLGEMCSLITKQTGFDYSNHIKDKLIRENKPNHLPYIQTKFFTGRVFNLNTDYYIPNEIAFKFPKIVLDTKCILLSIVGASIGNIGLYDTPVKSFLGGAIGVAKPNTDVNVEFLYYYLTSHNGQKQIFHKVKGAGQATITIEDIREFLIPQPSVEEQQQIVSILDRFDKLTTDITAGLPAEIEARRKQYEYYRDRLLTFNKK